MCKKILLLMLIITSFSCSSFKGKSIVEIEVNIENNQSYSEIDIYKTLKTIEKRIAVFFNADSKVTKKSKFKYKIIVHRKIEKEILSKVLTKKGLLTMQLLDMMFMRRIPFTYKGSDQASMMYITNVSMISRLKKLFKKAYENPNKKITIKLKNPITGQNMVIPIPADSNVYEVRVYDKNRKRITGAVILKRKILLDGNAIKLADCNLSGNANDTRNFVNFEFTNEGATEFANITRINRGKTIALLLDGIVRSCPRVHEPITTGRAQISGNFSKSEARFLAFLLGVKPLRVPIKVVSITYNKRRNN